MHAARGHSLIHSNSPPCIGHHDSYQTPYLFRPSRTLKSADNPEMLLHTYVFDYISIIIILSRSSMPGVRRSSKEVVSCLKYVFEIHKSTISVQEQHSCWKFFPPSVRRLHSFTLSHSTPALLRRPRPPPLLLCFLSAAPSTLLSTDALQLSTNAAQLTVPIDDGQLMSGRSSGPPVLWLSTHAVQLTVLIGDDGQPMSGRSCGPPVLWLSTHAVQLTVPIGDEGQLMSGPSCGPPVLWLSTHAVQLTAPVGETASRCPAAPVARQSCGFLVHTRYS